MPPDPLDEELDPLEPGAKKSGPSVVVLIVLLLLGAGVGGYFGGPMTTPIIAEAMAGGGEGDDGYGEDDGYGGGGDGYGGAETEGPLTIENLFLNPSGSGASRFLIATLVLDADQDAQDELSSRDAEVRDMLLTILAVRTVEELSDISMRDEIREDLRSGLNDLLGREGVHRVFLPQFVIQ